MRINGKVDRSGGHVDRQKKNNEPGNVRLLVVLSVIRR